MPASTSHYRQWGVKLQRYRRRGVGRRGLWLISVVANDIAKRLLARVKELRKARGLSQEAFAERAGLKYKHYQALEAGRKNEFHFSTLIKMAEGLGLNLSELVDFDAAPMALAQDPAKDGFQATPRKAARKPAKRTAGQTRR